jgi:hypothetical protein
MLQRPTSRSERRESRLKPVQQGEDRMKKHLDSLSKDLASGMSRREALRLFFMGIGAATVGVFGGRSSSADGNAICVELCRAQELHGRDFGKCVSASAHCPPGECALCINQGDPGEFEDCVCIPVGDFELP